MTPTAERTKPHGTFWVAARWLLLGLVIAGVFGMHVLSEHDAAGGHGMMTSPTAAAADHSDHMAMPAVVAMPTGGPTMSAVPDSGRGMSAGMATCILFLVVGASLILLAFLLLRRAVGKGPVGERFWLWSGLSQRGPPGSGPPRISLFVLRV